MYVYIIGSIHTHFFTNTYGAQHTPDFDKTEVILTMVHNNHD